MMDLTHPKPQQTELYIRVRCSGTPTTGATGPAVACHPLGEAKLLADLPTMPRTEGLQ